MRSTARSAPARTRSAATLAALRRAAGDGQGLAVASRARSPALRPLLEAGFRIDDRDTFMASEPDLVDPPDSSNLDACEARASLGGPGAAPAA